MSTDANDLLMGGGIKAVNHDQMGVPHIGTIIDTPKVVQMTEYQSTKLAYWPSGDPMMQIVVLVQTDERDPTNSHDDGRRRLFISPRMMAPVREAIQNAGARGLAIGGRIATCWVSGSGQGEGNPKVYAAEYQPPAVEVGSMLGGPPAAATPAPMLTQPAPAQAAPPAAPAQMLAQPAQQYAAAAAPASMLAQPAPTQPAAAMPGPTMASMLAAPPVSRTPSPNGVDPGVWASMPDDQRRAVLAAMVNPAVQVVPF